jgi:hypothetical protein
VEATGSVKTFLEEWGMVALGNIDVRGNITVTGNMHSNGDAYFGPGDVYLKSGAYDEGYPVIPPPIFTEPTAWPSNTTYYRVQYSSSPARGRIYRYDYATGFFEKVLSDSLTGSVIGYKQGTNTYTVGLTGDVLKRWFDVIFAPTAPGSPVVVDFGQSDVTGASVTDLTFNQSDASWQLKATIIDTRFEGVDESVRTAPCSGAWKGGVVTFKSKLTLAPGNCVTMIVNQLGPNSGLSSPAQVSLGTQSNPGVTYVTGNVNGVKGDLAVWGALISLCDISSQGGPTINWVPGIEDCLPFDFKTKGSGFFHLREWREVPL